MTRRTLIIAAIITVITAGAACAGPVLDDILNYMFMDQTVQMKGGPELWPVDHGFPLAKGEPVGQTFMTGSETAQIVRIRACVAANPDWQQGEGAKLILWDSPAKKTPLGRYTIWYEYRGYHYNYAEFEVRANVRPSTQYYFEISYVGVGDGKVGNIGVIKGTDGYKGGQGYLAGKEADFDICLQTHAKRAPDRIGNLKKAFARFDLGKPELAEIKAAVDKEDFDTAVARTVAYFETRQKPTSLINPEDVPEYDPLYDTTMGDLGVANYFKATTPSGYGYIGPDMNWRADVFFDEKGHKIAGDMDLHRFGARGAVTQAYLRTGNEKYARKFNDMMLDWYLDNPPPPQSHIGGVPWDPVWSSLNTGIRLGHGFAAYSRAHTSPFFTTDCRFAWILDLADHADTLVMVGAGAGGNWSFTQNGSLMHFAVNFREIKNHQLWFDTAAERISNSLKEDFLPDGVETESAPGYQRFATKPVAQLLSLLKERNVKSPFSDNVRVLLEKQAEYFMFMTMPDGSTPFLGDWGGDGMADILEGESKRFDRPDMLYVSTAGKQGSKPAQLSKLYPYAGVVTMRSDWGGAGKPYEDARYLMLHGIHWGAHGHNDLNGITCYAYGRELLMDPGSYIYSSPEHALLTESVSHNLMTIDGQYQRQGKASFSCWSNTPVADYLSSKVEGYKAGAHNREVYYIRSNGDVGAKDYWVVRDTAEGTGQHSIEQRWHFMPDSGAKADKTTLTTTTAYPDKGNLAIMQIDPSRLQLEESTADVWRPRGANAPPKKMLVSVYSSKATLPAAIDTVLFPFAGAKAPAVQTKSIEDSPDGMSSVFQVVQGNVKDLFVAQKMAGKKTVASEKVTFDGERLFLRRVGGKLRSALVVNGSTLMVDGKQVVKCSQPAAWIAVSFDASGVHVYTSSAKVKPVVAAKGKAVVKSVEMADILKPAPVQGTTPRAKREKGK